MTLKSIEVLGLKKYYGNIKAVDGVDFYVEPGSLFAFLGPNGAGKSTVIDILCTLSRPQAGQAFINGMEIGREDEEIRSEIGAVFQEGVLDRLLSVRENLMLRGSFYGLKGEELKKRTENALLEADAAEFADRRYGKLSGGQRRRADIARALVNSPKILFLDEPTTGLDPQTRAGIWETVRRLQRENGMTVFLTTHYMEEADSADYVVVLDNGRVKAKGTPNQLKKEYAADCLKLYGDVPHLIDIIKETRLSYSVLADGIKINLENTLSALPLLEKARGAITGFEVAMGDMDDAFMGITGKEIRE